jgi:trypsin-like peptidase
MAVYRSTKGLRAWLAFGVTVALAVSAAFLPQQAEAGHTWTRSAAASALSPGKFAEVSSGVTLIRAFPCSGGGYLSGSGFMIGDRIVMTARHVVDPPGGPKVCRVRVRVKGKWVGAASWNWWYSQRPSDGRLVDLAAIKLSERVDAYSFRIRPTPVPLGTNLAMVGHPLGNKLSITQGKLLARKRISGVPRILVNLLGAEGASGSAFLDDKGNVVGVLQEGLGGKDAFGQKTSGAIIGLDLNSWWGNGKRSLCRAYPDGGIPMCGSRPTKPKPPAKPTAPPASSPSPAPLTITDAYTAPFEGGTRQARFESTANVSLWVMYTLSRVTTESHSGTTDVFNPSGVKTGAGCAGPIRIGLTDITCHIELGDHPAAGTWRIVTSIDGITRSVSTFEVIVPTPQTVVADVFLNGSETGTDRQSAFLRSAGRVYLHVLFRAPLGSASILHVDFVRPDGAYWNRVDVPVQVGWTHAFAWSNVLDAPFTGTWRIDYQVGSEPARSIPFVVR